MKTVTTVRQRMAQALALGAVLALAAGCTTSKSSSAASGPSATSPSNSNSSKYFIIDVSGPLSDPFFGAFKLGSDTAAKELGINYQYSAAADETNIEADYTRLLQAAIGRHPDALVVGDYIPWPSIPSSSRR